MYINLSNFLLLFNFNCAIPSCFGEYNVSELADKNQLKIKNIVYIDTNFQTMFAKFKNIGFAVILNESPFAHHRLLEEYMKYYHYLNLLRSKLYSDL